MKSLLRKPHIREIILERGNTGALHLERNSINILPHAQQVAPRNLHGIVVADAPPQQLGKQVRELGHVLEPAGCGLDAVKVAADADVVVADQLADVNDVTAPNGARTDL